MSKTGAAAVGCPVNPATFQFTLSKYPTNGGVVSQFPDDHSRASYRGKFYISLNVRASVKDSFKLRSPIRSISKSALYSSRTEANLEVLIHRCMIEGLEKRGEWFVPSSSSAKFKKSSLDQEVAAIEANIKSLRKAIEEKSAVIFNLENQLCNERSNLAAIHASLHQAEAASASFSTSAIPRDDYQPVEDNDEAMAPSNDSCTPSEGISITIGLIQQ